MMPSPAPSLKDDSDRLQAIVNSALDGLITINKRGIVESFNPACERIFGYGTDEVVGQNIKMLMPEPYRAEHDGYIDNYQKTGNAKIIGTAGREVSGRRKDGSIFPLELSVSHFALADGTHYCGIIRDITGRKEAENEIEKSLASLKRSNQELDDFAHIASHDLKEPLRGLSNNAIFLKEDCAGKLDGAQTKRLDRMVYLCERMERLVNDLLYFSRLGRQELAVQLTDLNAVIKDIETMMETTLHEKNATLHVDGTLPTLVCDLPRITEVFRNLITNAVKYNDKPDKRITIGCETTDKERIFFVADNGIGIAAQFYQDVFRIFKRLNDEDDGVKGTGVGLTFVKKIIERHDGRVWVESEMGVGTRFLFTINQPKGEEA